MCNLLDLTNLKAKAQPFSARPVIYFLFRKGCLVYVGQSENVYLRIGTHATGANRKEFDSFAIVPVPNGVEPRELELRYIEQFEPIYNCKGLRGKSWKVNPELFRGPIHRALRRIDDGESIKEAAKSERITEGVLRWYHSRREGDEENKLLLPRRNAGPSQAGIRKHRHASLGVHQESRRGRAKKDRPVKENARPVERRQFAAAQGKLFD